MCFEYISVNSCKFWFALLLRSETNSVRVENDSIFSKQISFQDCLLKNGIEFERTCLFFPKWTSFFIVVVAPETENYFETRNSHKNFQGRDFETFFRDFFFESNRSVVSAIAIAQPKKIIDGKKNVETIKMKKIN